MKAANKNKSDAEITIACTGGNLALDSNAVSNTGGTAESEALAKQQATDAVGQMMQQAAVNGENKKEQVYQNADSQLNTFTKYLADSKQAQAQQKAQGIQGAFSGAAGAAGVLDDLLPF